MLVGFVLVVDLLIWLCCRMLATFTGFNLVFLCLFVCYGLSDRV